MGVTTELKASRLILSLKDDRKTVCIKEIPVVQLQRFSVYHLIEIYLYAEK